MSSFVPDAPSDNVTRLTTSEAEQLAPTVTAVALQDRTNQTELSDPVQKPVYSYQPMRIYTRHQMLYLSKSPLIQLPPSMPELRDWFGSENEQNFSKKESEPTTPSSTRERRFRRDMEESETPSRSTFRSTLSQPSQMGNFKHQSLRTGDRDRERDRERDTEKDRERDIRDKEGHERLRHLSDKYDRERLALPASVRSKERDAAPHLSAGPSSRIVGQNQIPLAPSRRGEARDSAKKKAGEVSEDWRKGPDLRSTRDERQENGRKDREDRERARSRARDSSRARREPSVSRRDREREKDIDRDADDDPRRWRDDGKRDERMAAKRAERHTERLREKESALEPGDRRWVAGEEREGRVKRPTARDRKIGSLTEEGKERDERKEREREREKEPAWMDTYIPSSSSGILGGKVGDGELDGIQAWKKERKEKEMKDKSALLLANGNASTMHEATDMGNLEANGNPLDEIQLFRLLMKREEEKKKSDTPDDHSQRILNEASHVIPATSVRQNGTYLNSAQSQDSQLSVPSSEPHPTSIIPTPTSLLSLLDTKEPKPLVSQDPSSNAPKTLHSTPDKVTTLPHTHIPQTVDRPIHDSVPPQFNPPPGSRLLAFARVPPATGSRIQNSSNTNSPPSGTPQLDSSVSKVDTLQPPPGFSPFEDKNQSAYSLDDNDHTSYHDVTSSDGTGYSANKGSRFAKFFDAKGRNNAPIVPKTFKGPVSSSPGPGSGVQKTDLAYNHGNGPDPHAMDEIYAMLSSSAQAPRGPPLHNANPITHSSNGGFGPHTQGHLQFQHQHTQQPQQLHASRLEPLYESRPDERNFVPDGIVSGLRTAPPRGRENPGLYTDSVEEVPYNVQQRLAPQQRSIDQMYPVSHLAMYSQQGARNPAIPLQQSHQFRGGPSPISHQQNSLQNNQQRLPPGLANLGGRPPHEPSQFLGIPSMPAPGLHNGMHLNGPSQQQPFNAFPPGSNLGYGGSPAIRGPHQLQSSSVHLPMGSLGHPNNLDLRSTSQNPLLGISGMRSVGGFPGQPGPGHMPPLLAMRHQQQQQLPPHMMPHLIPPHLQQVPSSQSTQDLMTLLMGSSHRE